MFTLFNQVVNASASYYVIMHYKQPQSLSKKVEQISVIDYEKLNITFHYCPTDPGCRVVIGEEENLTFRFSKGTFTATIQHEKRTQLVGKISSNLMYSIYSLAFFTIYGYVTNSQRYQFAGCLIAPLVEQCTVS